MINYLKCLFYLEHLRSNLLADNFKGVTCLMRQLDWLAQENQDLMMRAYSRLF